ncbi:Kelch-like protein 32 isoform X5 [Aix galericulata]|nr:Kelch-like protein 32 isoform X5 [Aix galericulata]
MEDVGIRAVLSRPSGGNELFVLLSAAEMRHIAPLAGGCGSERHGEGSCSVQEMLTGQRLCQSSSHNDAVLAALNQQRSDGILCDITLIAEEQKFHAHKAVLAACSDYFRAMFSLCMVESEADEILLEPGVIQDVLAAGSHLQLLELLSLCSHYLIQVHCRFTTYVIGDTFARKIPTESHLAVRWLEHNCRYQYMDELLQYVRFGLMDVDTLHTVALSHPLVQASETATALVNEALAYHQSIYAQPVWQTRRTKPRFQSDTLYIIGGKKREVCKVKELRYFNPVDQENVHIAGIANWSELAPMPVGRSHHCVAVMGDFLFVAGGEAEHSTGRTCAVRTACRYDPRTNSWAEIAPMKNCREHFVLGAVDEYLYANKWLSRSPMLQRRVYHSMAAVQRKLYVLGGNDLDYNNDRILVKMSLESRSTMVEYISLAAIRFGQMSLWHVSRGWLNNPDTGVWRAVGLRAGSQQCHVREELYLERMRSVEAALPGTHASMLIGSQTINPNAGFSTDGAPRPRQTTHSIHSTQMHTTAKIKPGQVFFEDLNDLLMLKQALISRESQVAFATIPLEARSSYLETAAPLCYLYLDIGNT